MENLKIDELAVPEDYLEHHGIKGQKWGVRRFQNSDGSLTAEGRKRRGLSDGGRESRIQKMIGKSREKRAAKDSSSAEDKKAKIREAVIKNPKKLPKYGKLFTKEETNKIISEIEWNRKLADVRREEIRRGMKRVESLANNLNTFANLTNSAINTWNNAVAINNTLVDTGVFKNGKEMPYVNRNQQKKDKDKD